MKKFVIAFSAVFFLCAALMHAALAEKPEPDLSRMSLTVLNQLKEDIASEYKNHYEMDDATREAVKKAAEDATEKYYRGKQIKVSWAWHSWEYEYKRDKDFFTFQTHLDYKYRSNKNHRVDVKVEVVWDGTTYNFYQLFLDQKRVLTLGDPPPENHLIDTSNSVISRRTGINLSLLTENELKDLEKKVNTEIVANHYAGSSNKVNSVLIRTVENIFSPKGIRISWLWFDYAYTCDWNCYTETTKITWQENGENHQDVPVYAELFPVGDSYQVYYLKIGEDVLIDELDQVNSEQGLLFLNSRKYENAVRLFSDGRYEEAMNLLDQLDGFEDSEELRSRYQELRTESVYARALQHMEKGNYEEAAALFESLGDFADSRAKAERCRTEQTTLRYNQAVYQMEQGEYDKAIDGFSALSGYLDSDLRAEECREAIRESRYIKALDNTESENYEEALEILDSLDGYKDSAEQAERIRKILAAGSRQLRFAEPELYLFPKDKTVLMPEILPDQENRQSQHEVIYRSSDSQIVRVEKDGTVTAVRTGDAVIHCESVEYPSLCADITIHVVKHVSKVTLHPSRITLTFPSQNEKSMEQLIARTEPLDAYVQTGIWSSGNEAVATVDQEGRLTAVGTGKTVIVFTSVDTSGGKKEARCNVTVVQAATSVELQDISGMLYTGKTIQLKATVRPKNAANKKLIWSSSNEAVAKVSTNGKVRAVSPGEAVITVSSPDGPFAQYAVRVELAPVTLKISSVAEPADPARGGKEWEKQLYLNDMAVRSAGKETVEKDDLLAIRYEIWRKEKLPDKGSIYEEIRITPEIMKNGMTIKKNIVVYADDESQSCEWVVTISIKP